MQTILGANGVISKNLALHLPSYDKKIRLVSRNPKKVNPTDELFSADLLNKQQTIDAVSGASVVYLTAGLTYNVKTWQAQWPVVMQNVIDACKLHGARLVFFDNVYCYGKVEGWMTEETPLQPCSKKGEVRARIAQMVLDEVSKGNLHALIARAPDFYGPHTPLSFINATIFDNFAKGKPADVLVSDKFKHSFIYTPDAGKATAVLGNTPEAFDQVWHLPTDRNPLTMKEIVEVAAEAFGSKPKYRVLSPFMISLVGMFIEAVRESKEMLYQYDSPYLFDSSKFEKAFPGMATAYKDGIRQTVNSYLQQ